MTRSEADADEAAALELNTGALDAGADDATDASTDEGAADAAARAAVGRFFVECPELAASVIAMITATAATPATHLRPVLM